MRIKAFIYLPETDIALATLGDNPDFYKEIVIELNNIKQELKKNEYDIHYDSGNIRSFLEVAEQFIPKSYFGIKNQLETIIGRKSRDVNLPVLRNPECLYANWTIDLNIIASPFVVQEALESLQGDTANEKTCCICLGNSLNTEREAVHVIKDLFIDSSLPVLVSIDAINSNIGFIKWLTTFPEGKFSLKKNKNFEPTNKRWDNKEIIYKHIISGQYWYFDFFHRNNKVHYEVFDHVGDHIGEANSDGNIDTNAKDEKKKISYLL